METSSTNWQKVAVLSTILLFTVPAVFNWGWRVLYPEHQLFFQSTPVVTLDGISTGAVVVWNRGEEREENVVISVDLSGGADKELLRAAISDKTDYGAFDYGEFQKVKLTDSGRVEVNVGRLSPGQGVSIALHAEGETLADGKTRLDPDWFLHDSQVSSDYTVGQEVARQPEYAGRNFRAEYFEFAPYLLALFGAIIGVIVGVSMIYDLFFSSPQKSMTALWRQMDLLQEKIDKERRYQ